uniref:Uncharacterized protein n=1 Tax=Chlamydomonas leiostraca TaxID=1034604 RepID=A0A7S0RSS3_9CHLO
MQRGSPRGDALSRAAWTPSTALPSTAEKAQALQAVTQRSVSATRTRVPAARTPLVAGQDAFLQRVREDKAARGVDVAALEASYGKEGAAHMQDILRLRALKAEREAAAVEMGQTHHAHSPAARRRRGGRTTADDLAAVRALPDDPLVSHTAARGQLGSAGSQGPGSPEPHSPTWGQQAEGSSSQGNTDAAAGAGAAAAAGPLHPGPQH